MKKSTLEEKLKEHQNLLNEKIRQLNEIETLKNNLINEIIELRGKVKLLKQLIFQEKQEYGEKSKPKSENSK